MCVHYGDLWAEICSEATERYAGLKMVLLDGELVSHRHKNRTSRNISGPSSEFHVEVDFSEFNDKLLNVYDGFSGKWMSSPLATHR